MPEQHESIGIWDLNNKRLLRTLTEPSAETCAGRPTKASAAALPRDTWEHGPRGEPPRGATVMVVKAVLFDLGDTLIYERVDDAEPLDQMQLHVKPHARQVLEELSRGFSLALVTDTETSREPVVRRALARLGLEQFFDAIVTSQDLGSSKPEPAIFQEALRRIGVAPKEAVMVGNDLDRDVAGAARLGLRTILVANSRYYDPLRETTSHIALTLADVPDLIIALDAADEPAAGAQ